MCFMLFAATEFPLPRIPWNEHDRHVYTEDIGDANRDVVNHFSLPHVAYVGSSLNCGCGFRHIMFQGGDWPGEAEYFTDEDTIEKERRNLREMCDFHMDDMEEKCPDYCQLVAMLMNDVEERRQNHRELHDVLLGALRESVLVELYGCWADEYKQKTEQEQDVELDRLLSDLFVFRERVLYRIKPPSPREANQHE